jgi:hypothetical protein
MKPELCTLNYGISVFCLMLILYIIFKDDK